MFLSPDDAGTDGFTDDVADFTDVAGQTVTDEEFADLSSSFALFPGKADLLKNSVKPACFTVRFFELDSLIKLT